MDAAKKEVRLDYEIYTDFEDAIDSLCPSGTFTPGELMDFRLVPEHILFVELNKHSDEQLFVIADESWNYPDEERFEPVLDAIDFVLSDRLVREFINKVRCG